MTDLNRHTVKTHTKDLPFECTKCGAKFAQLIFVERHARLKHVGRRKMGITLTETMKQSGVSKVGVPSNVLPECVIKVEQHSGNESSDEPTMVDLLNPVSDSCFNKEVKSEHQDSCNEIDDFQISHASVEQIDRLNCEQMASNNDEFIKDIDDGTDSNRYKLVDGRFVCSYCDKTFSAAGSLKVHEANHSSDRPFVCAHCGKKFGCGLSLKKHAIVHDSKRAFPCMQCGKSFNKFSNMVTHLRQVHNGERPLKCTKCNKFFTKPCDLTRHTVCAHGGERSFSCTHCKKRFVQASDLNQHIKRVHSFEFPFECAECGKGFTEHIYLDLHMTVSHSKKTTNNNDTGGSNDLTSQTLFSNDQSREHKILENGMQYN